MNNLLRKWMFPGSILFLIIALGVGLTAFAHTPGNEAFNSPVLFTDLDNGLHDTDPSVGSVRIEGNLTFSSGGGITCLDIGAPNVSACNIDLEVTGDLVMEAGSSILTENQTSGGDGGDINLMVGGDLTMKGGATIPFGAKISSSKTSVSGTGAAGDITIEVTGNILIQDGAVIEANKARSHSAGEISISGSSITIYGTVESAVLSGSTGVPAPVRDGGPISIVAGCSLFIGDSGIISSRGKDNGADLVHLEGGCGVTIYGLVESTGNGHSNPSTRPNKCIPLFRPDKPANSTRCVEVWAGDFLIIDSKNHNGVVHADMPGGAADQGNHSWIDLFSRGDITIIGDITGSYSVHANAPKPNKTAGDITLRSRDGKIALSGQALMANGNVNNANGGKVLIEAHDNITMEDAVVLASGFGNGGSITMKSFNQNITGNAASLADTSGSVAGSIIFITCTSVNYTGNSSPTYVSTTGVCGGSPSFASYITLPDCICKLPDPDPECVTCDGEVVVDENVFVNFNGPVPTCTDGATADLCAYASYDMTGATPDTWKVIFNLGAKGLQVLDNVTITTAQVPLSGNNRYAPGIEIYSTCNLFIEGDLDGNNMPGQIVVESKNKNAGDIRIEVKGNITVNGHIRNEVTGTRGFPGEITIATCCGDIHTGPMSRVETIGLDAGGNDINIITCKKDSCAGGDILIEGLVRAFHKYRVVPHINIIASNGYITIDGTNIFGLERTLGGRIMRTSGVLTRSARGNEAGFITIQATKDITVIGNHIIDKRFTQYGAVAVKTNAVRGTNGDGKIHIQSLEGSFIATDRAVDIENRFNVDNEIKIESAGSIDLSVTALVDDGASDNSKAVVSSQGGKNGQGGTNFLRSYSGDITIEALARVLANTDHSSGTNGTNTLTACGPITTTGVISPVAITATGQCAPTSPAPIYVDCSAFHVSF